MADLMTGTVTYQKLANQYANFIVPAAKVKVNGTDVVKANSLVIQELEVTLPLDAAGSVVIKFADLYDEINHAFDAKTVHTFRPGTVVDIELGYLSTTQKVFRGYVAMLGVEMGEAELLVVTLMDVKRLMMVSGKKCILHKERNYSDAFQKVMGSYTALCSTRIDATSDQLEEPIPQISNDYDFIMHELIGKGKADREFIVCAGVAYFRRPQKVSAPILTLRYGRELLSLSIAHCYQDLNIEVISADRKEAAVTGRAKTKANTAQKKLLSKTPVSMETDSYAQTKSRADTAAQAAALQEKKRSSLGRGSTLGIPEIIPGRYIKVENVDAFINQKYYITEVTHSYRNDTFITQFEIGGC